jgi:hypothetical protein
MSEDELASQIESAKQSKDVDFLIEMLSNDSSFIRRHAVLALTDLKDKRALEPLISLLKKEFAETVIFSQLFGEIVIAIGRIPDARGLEALTEIERLMIDDNCYKGFKDDSIYYGKYSSGKVVWHGLHQKVLDQMKIISNVIGAQQKMVKDRQDSYAQQFDNYEKEKRKWEDEERKLRELIDKRDREIAQLKAKEAETRKSIKSKPELAPEPEPVPEPILEPGVVITSPLFMFDGVRKWFSKPILATAVKGITVAVIGIGIIILIAVLVSTMGNNGNPIINPTVQPYTVTTTTTIITTKIPIYIGTWTGNDDLGKEVLIIEPYEKFEHQIWTSSGEKVYTGTYKMYSSNGNYLELTYTSGLDPNTNYVAHLSSDGTFTSESGYVPNMPIGNLQLTHSG